MSVIERKGSIRSESVYNEDYTHRYILRKEWDKEKKKAVVIMIQPNTNDPYELDMTTVRVINNLNKIGYGYADIVNLYSRVSTKLNLKLDEADLLREENDGYIIRSCMKSDVVILAWGSIEETSVKVAKRIDDLMVKLEPFKEKLHIICDEKSNVSRQPLAPTVANHWRLVKVRVP